MGLAASQGRYLCLTARMSDLIYEGQQISQQRLALAKESSAIAEEYTEAMSNRVLQANILNENGERQSLQLTYGIITSKDSFSGLGMRIVDLNGNVVVPKKSYTMQATSKDEEGNDITETFTSSAQFVTKYMNNLTPDEANEMGSLSLQEVADYYNKVFPENTLNLSVTTNIDESLKGEDEKYLFDENCEDPEYLQRMLTSGEWIIEQQNPEAKWEEIVWQGSTRISDVLDTSDDAAAEAKYEAAMKELQKKDKTLELRLEEVQTEESAVEKEIESIKDVINKNIEDSFGTFA